MNEYYQGLRLAEYAGQRLSATDKREIRDAIQRANIDAEVTDGAQRSG
jgi:hypothetical protein